jgi:hypothetical protein
MQGGSGGKGMKAQYFLGMTGAAFNVESRDDLIEALDILHTQVIDNMGDDCDFLRILEDAMSKIEDY